MFKGVFTASVTPFTGNKIDIAAFDAHIKRQKKVGINGIVVGGCTGESFTLKHEENLALWETAMKYRDNGFSIILGAASNTMENAEKLVKAATAFSPDGLLVITPFANKPSQQGLYEYFQYVAGLSTVPVILYNVPGRTGVSLTAETVARLAKIERITAIKQAVADFDEFTKLKFLNPGFNILSGEDSLTLPLLAIGGDGVICTSSNLVPELWVQLFKAFSEKNIEEAATIHCKLFPLLKSLFIEGNPTPLKFAMACCGLSNGEVRKPLVEVSETTKTAIKKELTTLGLIK